MEHTASHTSSTAQPECERLRWPSRNKSTLGEEATCSREVKHLIPTAGSICTYIPHPSSSFIYSILSFFQFGFHLLQWNYTTEADLKWKTYSSKLILLKAEAPEEFLLYLADGFITQEGLRTSVRALHYCRRLYSQWSPCECCPLQLCRAQHAALEAAFFNFKNWLIKWRWRECQKNRTKFLGLMVAWSKNGPWAIITNICYLVLGILLRILHILSHLILHKMWHIIQLFHFYRWGN